MERNLRKERIGVVVSNKNDKTIIVAVETKKMHPLYGKFIKQTTKFVAQDEKNEPQNKNHDKIQNPLGKPKNHLNYKVQIQK